MVECEFNNYDSHKKSTTGFNRYMVECEYTSIVSNRDSRLCFNRYMVECECIYKVTCAILRTVLIDTWWNVNEKDAKHLLGSMWF